MSDDNVSATTMDATLRRTVIQQQTYSEGGDNLATIVHRPTDPINCYWQTSTFKTSSGNSIS